MLFRLFQKKEAGVKGAGGKPPLLLHNTLGNKVEAFEPLGKEGPVKMYNCGPTVYDRVTVGNLRAYVFADTLRRALLAWGYELRQVINITDFGHLVSDADEGEDKMSKGLRREGLAVDMENMRALAGRYMEAFLSDLKALGVDTAHIAFPRASDFVPEQIALVKALEEKGYAYETRDGVYFDTAKFPDYGKLGRIDLTGQQEGARLKRNEEKRSAHDFALWKKDDSMGWESPWGRGFPGWHIECTAMVFALLGKQVDIHTGGVDHVSVHHNNELAQAEALTGKPFAKYWLHNEFLTVDEKRVGKSEGNAIYLSDITARGYSPKALRYFYLGGHYRSPMNFSWEALGAADTALARLQEAYAGASEEGTVDAEFMREFYERAGNDLGTPGALALVWSKLRGLNRATLRACDELLGLGLAETETLAAPLTVESLSPGIRALVESREAARKNKDFEKADQMRQEIESAGYALKDTPMGPQITKK